MRSKFGQKRRLKTCRGLKLGTFLCEKVLRDEASSTRGMVIVNSWYVYEEVEKKTPGFHGIFPLSCFSWSTWRHMGKLCGRKGSVLHWMCKLIGLELYFGLGDLRAFRIPKIGGVFLLKGSEVPRQSGHNDYSFRAGESSGYSMIIIGSEAPNVFVNESS